MRNEKTNQVILCSRGAHLVWLLGNVEDTQGPGSNEGLYSGTAEGAVLTICCGGTTTKEDCLHQRDRQRKTKGGSGYGRGCGGGVGPSFRTRACLFVEREQEVVKGG